jgi:hypothetical protein
LARAEALQMVTDLGTAIGNVISLAAEMSDTDKVFAMDTVILLHTKRSVLEGELRYSDCAAAERDLDVLKQAAERRGGGQ